MDPEMSSMLEDLEKSAYEGEMRLKIKWTNDAVKFIADLAQSLENSSFESSSDEMVDDLEDFVQKVADVVDYEIADLKDEAAVEVVNPICNSVSTSIQRVISKFESCLDSESPKLRPLTRESIDGSLSSLRFYKQTMSVA